ncbi:MAG: DUF952 domain-containing protein [Maledivibacter sp.]|nr:DUF952 domain-containing protein [Maledivibacter sp.]
MIIYTATCKEWDEIKKQTEFTSDDFSIEGFIHCSYPKQTVRVLNKHFKDEEKVILLCIDPRLLKSKWKSEDLKGNGEEFPHVYGNINIDAIVKVLDIQPSKYGLFHENSELRSIIESIS